MTQTTPITKAMLMCAGLGTRLQPFTHYRTKALMPLMGIPVVQFTIDSLISAGVKKFVVNVHHLANETQALIKSLDHPGKEVQVSDESALLLGGAGGIRKALPLLGNEPFFLSNADVLCNIDWNALAAHHKKLREKHRVEVTWAVFPRGPSGENYREVLYNSSDLITGLGDKVSDRPFFIGAAVIEPEALAAVPAQGPAEFVPTVLEPAIRKGRAGVFLSDGLWFDIGSPLLWRNAHLSLLELLEEPPSRDKQVENWKKRIRTNNTRIGNRAWISKSSENAVPQLLNGPAYWNLNERGGDIPSKIGPDTILYGSVANQKEFGSGIGFAGQWVDLA